MQKAVYALLAALRFAAAALSLAMIHPDEFFQSQEVMARHVLHRDAALQTQLHLPWEFDLPSPNRSILFPSLVAGLPYLALQALGVTLTGTMLLLVPRLLLCTASFAIDLVLYRCAARLGHRDPAQVVLSFASAWTTLVFLTRPFSNTVETLVLALCLAALLCLDTHRRIFFGLFHSQTLALGSLLAVGVFTRFTFPFFFLPLGLELVRRQDERLCHAKKAAAVSASTRLAHALGTAAQGLLAFLLSSSLFVALDSWYFLGTLDWRALVVAPWNNLQYNLQTDNLALHGVHPRWTHALVNLPLLFGPLVLAFFVVLARQPARHVWQAACVAVPLLLLSLAPHQEPRFLLPLLVPLHLFAGRELMRSTWRMLLWVVFNVALGVFFGVLHQGGLLPFLLAMSGDAPAVFTRGCVFHQPPPLTVPLVFYKTYMPPRFALASGSQHSSDFRVVDLAGGRETATQLAAIASHEIVVAAPASVDIGVVATAWGGSVEAIGRCAPHVSTEDLAWDKPFALIIYRIVRS